MIKGAIQHLARQSAFYALGNVAVKVGGLVFAPILLNPRYLDVASYGYLALMLVTAQLGVVVAGVGVSSGLLRFWTHPDYRDRTHVLASTALVVCTGLGVVVPGLVYLLFSEDLARLLLDDRLKTDIVGLILAYTGFKIIGSVSLVIFRVRERPVLYGFVQLTEVALLIGLAVYWLVAKSLGLEGVVRAYAAAAGITTLLATALAFMPTRWKPSLAPIGPLIAFGAPLALANVSAWILNSSDRYLLKWFTEPTVIATYDWASRVAGIINVLIVQSFLLTFVVVGLRRLDEKDVSLHREMFRHFVVWSGWTILILAVFTDDAMSLMALMFDVDERYVGISGLVLLVGIGFCANGLNQIVATVLVSEGRTVIVAASVGAGAVANILLNIALIPLFGAMGAAAATALAFLILTGVTTVFSERSIKAGYSWSLAALVLLLSFGLYFASIASGAWPDLLRLTFRIVLVIAYAPLLLLSRRYGVDEFRGGLKTIRSIVTFRQSGS